MIGQLVYLLVTGHVAKGFEAAAKRLQNVQCERVIPVTNGNSTRFGQCERLPILSNSETS